MGHWTTKSEEHGKERPMKGLLELRVPPQLIPRSMSDYTTSAPDES